MISTPGYVNKQASLMQMYYKSCVHLRTIKVRELLCCTNGYAMRIKMSFCIFKLAPMKARHFSLMFFCESLCINRISHNNAILQLVFYI